MPFFKEISSENCRGGIWRITESWEDLLKTLPRADYHHDYVCKRFRSEKRRLEYAAVRVLIFSLTGEDRDVLYLPSGRPYLAGKECCLSISHTAGYAAVLLTDNGAAGIDIEAYSPRVLKVKPRIAGPQESADTVYELLLHWSAKETVFKILDKEGIDFIEHFRIEGLHCTEDEGKCGACGTFHLTYHRDDSPAVCFPVSYLTSKDFVLTYAYSDIINHLIK